MTPISIDPSGFSNEPFARRIEKPWGYELLFTPPDKGYAGKLLHVLAGHRLSLQVHDEKHETIMLLRGRAVLQADDQQGELVTIAMELDTGYSNVPGQRHRLLAIEDSDFVEASTPESGTTYRLEDDHGRSHETEEVRASLNRGWEGNA